MDHPFALGGQTYVIVNTAAQIPAGAGQTFRLRNLSTSAQYLAWGLTSSVAVTTPATNAPQANTIGVAGSAVEKITIPVQALYFIASAATGFEVTQGDGI